MSRTSGQFWVLCAVSTVLPSGCMGPGVARERTTLGDALEVRAILDRAIGAYGGAAFLEGLNEIHLRLSGEMAARLLAVDVIPGDRETMLPRTVEAYMQIQEGNFTFGSEVENAAVNNALNGSNSNYTFILTPDARYLYFPKVGLSTRGFAPQSISSAAEPYVPHLVVRELQRNRAGVAWTRTELRGRTSLERLVYPAGVHGYTVFLFGTETGRLAAMEQLATDVIAGDVVERLEFEGYSGAGETLRPAGVGVKSRGHTLFRYEYEAYDLDADVPQGTFAPPPGYTIIRNVPFRGRRLWTYSEKVRFYGPSRRTMLVEFDDYVVVVGTSADDLDLIHETVPDKPIRYAIPTHHHVLHVEGVRSYVQAGATIVTTSRNEAFFRALAMSPRELNPDAQQEHPVEPKFEIVDDRPVFDDGTTRLEIINVGPVGHARDLYVAYLPNQGLAFAVDLFELNPEALPPTVADYYRDLAVANLHALEVAGIKAHTLVADGYTMDMDTLEAIVLGRSGR